MRLVRFLKTFKKHLAILAGIIAVCVAAYTVFIIGLIDTEEVPVQEEGPSLLQDVTVQLNWVPDGTFAGMYVAEQEGYYEKLGLRVKLLPYNKSEQTIVNGIPEGYGTFGITDGSTIVNARAQGVPIVAVACIIQLNSAGITVLASSSITTIEDLRGKHIGTYEPIDTGFIHGEELIVMAMLKRHGINMAKDMKVTPLYEDGVQSLARGDVDALVSFPIYEARTLESMGHKTVNFYAFDEEIKTYSDCLFVREDTIRNNPEIIKPFLDATIHGWETVYRNPNKGLQAVLAHEDIDRYGSMDPLFEFQLIKDMLLILKTTATTAIGSMEYAKWEEIYAMSKELGAFQNEFDIRAMYTNEYLSE